MKKVIALAIPAVAVTYGAPFIAGLVPSKNTAVQAGAKVGAAMLALYLAQKIA